jgi:hypothetical protein
MRLTHHIRLTFVTLFVCLVLSACVQSAPTSTDATSGSVPVDVNRLLDETQNQVASIRGLQAPTDLPRAFLTPEEIREKVVNEFFAEYTPEDAAKDAKSLYLLGLLPKDFELLDFYRDLYTEQIGGFYDYEIKSMYVMQSGAFSIIERTTYAHEFTHALQDHNFSFKEKLRFSDEDCEADSERCAAIQALIEGDASYTETLWFNQHASNTDFTDLQSAFLSMDLPVYNSAPAYIRDELTFPYVYGQQFVTQLYAKGGYTTINEAFNELQPVSTEQIMHPSRYPDDKPVSVGLPDLAAKLGKDWQVIETDSIGEWMTWLMLARGHETNLRLNDLLASAAAEGWAGDRFVILRNSASSEVAIAMRYIWDTPADEQEAFKAFADWLSLRFGAPDSSQKYVSTGITARMQASKSTGFHLILAEKPTTADSLMRLLP